MNKLYYFTGTGNSLWVAKQLAKQLPDFSLEPIAGIMSENRTIKNSDSASIGIVFPVYLFGPPLIVKRFLNKLIISKNQYVFCIAAHAGYPADAVGIVRKLARKNGGHLNSGFCVNTPGNYIIEHGPPEGEIIRERLSSGKERISEIAKMVKNRTNDIIEKGNPATNWIFSGLLYRFFCGTLPGYSKKYMVEDSCNACGICVSLCPVNNIKLINNKPVWGNACELCLSCIQNCPIEAIQWGKKTKKRRRYRNPEISIQELKEQKPTT